MYIAFIIEIILIYLVKKAQITILQAKKALTIFPTKYLEYINDFFFDLIMKFFKNTNINKYTIKLVNGKQLFYGPIYTLRLVKLETVKTYIKTHLKAKYI